MVTQSHPPAPPIWWTIKVTATLVLVVAFLVLFLGDSQGPGLWSVPLWVGQVLVGLGAGMALSQYFLLKRRNHGLALPDHLVTDAGLFRWIRHPMYLGDLFVLAGLTLLANRWWALLISALATVAIVLLCQSEDRHLLNRFPGQYAEYMRRTHRMLPFLY